MLSLSLILNEKLNGVEVCTYAYGWFTQRHCGGWGFKSMSHFNHRSALLPHTHTHTTLIFNSVLKTVITQAPWWLCCKVITIFPNAKPNKSWHEWAHSVIHQVLETLELFWARSITYQASESDLVCLLKSILLSFERTPKTHKHTNPIIRSIINSSSTALEMVHKSSVEDV